MKSTYNENLSKDTKSIGITVTLQSKDHTLTSTEIESIIKKIVSEVERKTGAKLRS